jgi:hypothetical protein
MVSQMSIEVSASDSISGFPVSPSDYVVLTKAEYEALLARIAELEEWRDGIEARTEVEKKEPPKEETAPSRDEISAVKAKTGILEMRMDDAFEAIEEHDAALAKLQRIESLPKPGSKSAARIERIESYLKAHGGTASFKSLKRELSLSDSQFSQLIAKIDKRRFIVMIVPQARDEKALRLRAFT